MKQDGGLSFKTQLKIKFLLPNNDSKKCLEKSLINEILTIKEYWNLIGRKPFLAIIWLPDFSQPSSFCRMLMNHKNFHFTQIPDKTNDVIFLKFWPFWPPWPFFTIFGHFCPMRIFFKKSSSVTIIYGLRTPC